MVTVSRYRAVSLLVLCALGMLFSGCECGIETNTFTTRRMSSSVETDAEKVSYECSFMDIDGRGKLSVLLVWDSALKEQPTIENRGDAKPFVLQVEGHDDYEPPPNSIVYYDGEDFRVLAENRHFSCRDLEPLRKAVVEIMAKHADVKKESTK